MKQTQQLNAKTHGNDLQAAYPEVVALRPRTCRVCGVEKLQLDFASQSKLCKSCRRDYVNSKKPKLNVTNGFVDMNLNFKAARTALKSRQERAK